MKRTVVEHFYNFITDAGKLNWCGDTSDTVMQAGAAGAAEALHANSTVFVMSQIWSSFTPITRCSIHRELHTGAFNYSLFSIRSMMLSSCRKFIFWARTATHLALS
jgi:hypothetical protein